MKATAVVVPSASPDTIEELGQKILKPLKTLKIAAIKSDGDYNNAGQVLLGVKRARDQVEKEIKAEIIDPIDKGLRALRKKYNAIDKPLAQLEADIKDRMTEWARKKTAKAIKVAEKKAAKAPTPEQAADIVALAERSSQVPAIPGVTAARRWDFEVTDLAAVPSYFEGVELRSIKKDPILKFIRATEGKVEIPGIKAVLTHAISGSGK